MHVRTITVEREYGQRWCAYCPRLAEALGWKLWTRTHCGNCAHRQGDPKAARQCGRRVDLGYRLFKVFAREAMRDTPGGHCFQLDSDQWSRVLRPKWWRCRFRGNCVIVGRGAPYILRDHPDASHVFVTPRERKK